MSAARPPRNGLELRPDPLIESLPMPVMELDAENRVVTANAACESFFEQSRARLRGRRIMDLVPGDSPLVALVAQVRARGGAITEYAVDMAGPRRNSERLVDIHVGSIAERPDHLALMLLVRSMADKMTRQLSHRSAARSTTALGAILAHEIKNPLSGIRGAAQLIEPSLPDDERALARLIRSEVDRIVRLVERFETLADVRPLVAEKVNIHEVLDHVIDLARSGFAGHVAFLKSYDPSLPTVDGSRDQLVQVFLNLVKNAAEAIGPDRIGGEIVITTAYRPGVTMALPTSGERVGVPLEVCVLDDGPGVPDDVLPHLFDPFVTSKANGSGLGLATVAKVISDHGGVVECERVRQRTIFRVLLPLRQRRND